MKRKSSKKHWIVFAAAGMGITAGLLALLLPAGVAADPVPRAITLSPSGGSRGTVATIDGEGYAKETNVTVFRDLDGNGFLSGHEPVLATTQVSSTGTFRATFTVDGDSFVPGVYNTINAQDGLRGSARLPATFDLHGKVTVIPEFGYSGDSFQVALQDFFPNRLLFPGSVTLGGLRVPVPGLGQLKTSRLGNLIFSGFVPFGSPGGIQTLSVDLGGAQITAFNVLSPTLTVSPSEAVANQTVVLQGANFTPANLPGGLGPHGVHQIGGAANGGITLNGTAITAATLNLDSDGMFYAEIVLPLNDTTVSPGQRMEFKATDNRGRAATATLTIKQRSLSVDPNTSSPGSRITVTGNGFVAGNPKLAAYLPIDISYAGTEMATVVPDASGSFRTTITVPINTSVASTNFITAVTRTFSWSADALHSVPAKSITINPNEGPPGTRITVTGISFPKFAPLTDFTIGNRPIMPLPVPATDALGNLTAFFTVPQLETGRHTVIVTARGRSSTIFFTVTAAAIPQAPRSVATPSLSSTQSFPPAPSALTKPPPTTPVAAFASLGDNLLRVWHFDKTLNAWMLYDRRPIFAPANNLDEVLPGKLYYIQVAGEQATTLNGKQRVLYAGWNLLHW